MRKYGLEIADANVDMNTLLEPNNVIPAWENGGEDAAEVSKTLLDLRQKQDVTRAETIKMTEAARIQQAEKKRLNEELKRTEKAFSKGNDTDWLTDVEYAETKRNIESARMMQASYKYMIDRMKRDLISLTLTINDLTESHRSKEIINEEEMSSMAKAYEQKRQATYRLE